jgi:hypothetical protein
MSMKNKGAIIAAVIAGLFVTESYAAGLNGLSIATAAGTVHCMGMHNCKSMGACKAGTNGCGGKNACRALNPKSITDGLTAKECTDKGGTVVQ